MKQILIFISVLLMTLTLASCQRKEEGKAKEIPIQAVKITSPRMKEIKRQFETATTAKAIQDSYINPKVAAEIKAFFVEEGETVKKDQKLAQLNKKDYQVGAAAGKAQLEAANAGLLQAEAAFEKVRLDHERYKRLLAKKSISQAEFDQVRSGYRQTEAGVAVAKAQVATARNGYEGNRLQVKYTVVKAPFDGYVAKRNGEIGQMASPQSPQAMFRVVNLTTLKLEIYISELEVAGITMDTRVEITFDAYPGKVEQGKIYSIGSIVDPTTKSVRVEVRLDNSDGKYRSGISARVKIDMPKQAYLVLPRNSIFTRDNESGQVFVMDSNQTVHPIEVLMGDTFDGMTVITKGLKGKETVVVGGGTRLEDGQKVEVVK